MGRPAKGQLIWTGGGWSGRFYAMVDGVRIRTMRPLGTDNRAVAARKLAALVSGAVSVTSAAATETFEVAGRQVVARQKADGLTTWHDRLRRLERYAFPLIGAMPVDKIRAADIRAVIDVVLAAGRARDTAKHMIVDCSTILGDLWRDETIRENVAAKVRVPKSAPRNTRARVVLTDAEFAAFMSHGGVDDELRTIALVSRTFGGMRTSDLHAWDWAHIDTRGWRDAYIPRPKTKSTDRLGLPDVLIPALKAWWDAHGRPHAGPVFPCRQGPRAGKRKGKGSSYAWHLREALWQAGIVRPKPGFDIATTEAERRTLCVIQSGDAECMPVDFHSFRRAYNTGLARAGVNVQTAMKLAGHRSAQTHMRYVIMAETLSAPADALPRL